MGCSVGEVVVAVVLGPARRSRRDGIAIDKKI
jgi:hypothetical protein